MANRIIIAIGTVFIMYNDNHICETRLRDSLSSTSIFEFETLKRPISINLMRYLKCSLPMKKTFAMYFLKKEFHNIERDFEMICKIIVRY